MAIITGGVSLGGKALERSSRVTGLYDRIAFSTTTYREPALAGTIFDRKAETPWTDRGEVLKSGRYFVPPDITSSLPDPRSLHLTVEVGLSHFPGRPPLKNAVRELIVWSGDQTDAQSFRAHARPRRIHLVFFLQALVDVDREYRFPGQPKFWTKRTVVLQDTPTPQRIALDFLPALPDSSRFPLHISQTWLRIIVETYYPGTKQRDLTAISELDFVEPHATFPPMPGNRSAWPLLHPSPR